MSGDDRPTASGSGGFGLFGEMLVTGVLVAAFSLPVVTFLPALAAGTSHLRRHLSGEVESVRAFAADFGAAVRIMWPLALGSAVVLGLLTANIVLLSGGDVPGGGPLATVMAVLAVAVAVVCLRSCVLWTPAASSSADLLRAALRRAGSDLRGSALLVVAIGACLVLAWMLVPLLVVVPGLLALALVAVEDRQSAGPESPAP